ncbi:hypothetical protein NQ318_002324 [Aromia moschata]|uniref:Protein takeout-like n=1 Tax=Aromia moschata TaxID=1265417 RepID=A0AAV8Z5R1_9CUCU|nr:hypothetical protein NQ318_002324 [Aromia moschata]
MMLVILMFCVVSVLGSQLPPGVKLCRRSDSELSSCLATNIADGIQLFTRGNKDLDVPVLEPFVVEKIEIEGQATSSTSLIQKYENIRMYGIADGVRITNMKIDIDKGCSWEFDAFSPVVTMEADYTIKGQVVVFPINSHGKCNITLNNLMNKNSMTCEKYVKNDKTYIKLTNYTMNMKPEKISFYFGNIFPEDERISAEVLKTLNENSLDIFNEVKPGFERAISFIYMNVANKVFSKIPIDDIFLE